MNSSIDKDATLARKWMRETGIALVYPAETQEELVHIWKEWQSLSDDDREQSDKKSIELFGMDNKSHYDILLLTYV